MISDPYDPEFRYPQPGERYWHIHWHKRCTVLDTEPELDHLMPRDEVLVRLEGGDGRAIVKLKSLVRVLP